MIKIRCGTDPNLNHGDFPASCLRGRRRDDCILLQRQSAISASVYSLFYSLSVVMNIFYSYLLQMSVTSNSALSLDLNDPPPLQAPQ